MKLRIGQNIHFYMDGACYQVKVVEVKANSAVLRLTTSDREQSLDIDIEDVKEVTKTGQIHSNKQCPAKRRR